MDESVRINATLRGKLAAAFDRERKKSLAPNSLLVRMALVEFLQARGYDVTDEDASVAWGGWRGGNRPNADEDEPGQQVARLAV